MGFGKDGGGVIDFFGGTERDPDGVLELDEPLPFNELIDLKAFSLLPPGPGPLVGSADVDPRVGV